VSNDYNKIFKLLLTRISVVGPNVSFANVTLLNIYPDKSVNDDDDDDDRF